MTTLTPNPPVAIASNGERLSSLCRYFEKYLGGFVALLGADYGEIQFMITWSLSMRSVLDCARSAGLDLLLDSSRPAIYRLAVPEHPEAIEDQIISFARKLTELLHELEHQNCASNVGEILFGNSEGLGSLN